jgi:hypothetical protein
MSLACRKPVSNFESTTPSLPSMRGRFTTPCSTSRPHTSAQVRRADEGSVVGPLEVTCSAVSGKSLARAPASSATARTPPPSSRRPSVQATGTCGALLPIRRFRVESRARRGDDAPAPDRPADGRGRGPRRRHTQGPRASPADGGPSCRPSSSRWRPGRGPGLRACFRASVGSDGSVSYLPRAP